MDKESLQIKLINIASLLSEEGKHEDALEELVLLLEKIQEVG